MPNKERFTVEQVARALRLSRGIPNRAAKRLKCDWHTVMDYINKYPQLRDTMMDAREQVLDVGEDKLFEAAERGEAWAVKFLLERLGAERGYAEKKELSGRGGAPLGGRNQVVIVKVPDNGRDTPEIEQREPVKLSLPKAQDAEFEVVKPEGGDGEG